MIALSLLACGLVAYGEMDDKVYNLTVLSNATSTAGYTLRGVLEAVAVDVNAGCTSTVKVTTSDGRVLFNKEAIAADAVYLPMVALQTTNGAAATFTSVGTNDANGVANAWYGKSPMAGVVTVSLTGVNIVGVTNNTKVTLIYAR